jgi:peptide deformylase
MPKLKIYTYGEPILRKAAKPLSDIKEEFVKLSEDMVFTMLEAKGVGLAANQIGRLDRIIVVQRPEDKEPLALINPEIIKREEAEALEEGCLSIPGINEKVKRNKHILLQAIDLKGKKVKLEAEGLLARILQHEVDHLDGILFIDRLSLIKKGILRPKLKALAEGIQKT